MTSCIDFADVWKTETEMKLAWYQRFEALEKQVNEMQTTIDSQNTRIRELENYMAEWGKTRLRRLRQLPGGSSAPALRCSRTYQGLA